MRSPNASADYDADIDIGPYLLALWRYGLIIAGAAIACGLLGFLLAARATPTYEATVQLAVGRATAVSPPPVATASYKAVVENQGVAAETVRLLGLDKPPLLLTASSLLQGVVSSELIPETSVIALKVRLPDPALAARVANTFADGVVQLVDRLNQENLASVRDAVKSQVDEAAARLNEARMNLEAARQTVKSSQLTPPGDMDRHRLDVARLEVEYDVARDAYTEVVVRDQRMRLQAVTSSAHLQRLDSAVPPDHPLSRHRLRNAVIGFAGGLLLSAFAVLALEMVRSAARPRGAAPPAAGV